ncbi:MAG: hypothetical protein BWY56_02582 [Acidobacteria bacterium ADurb.Bin340]|nr:MAG: hypothetical protein BWY56_02582 [Acidobacteria bacterium ADurb.Bin340]
MGAEAVEHIHQPLGQGLPSQGGPTLQEHPAHAPGGEFVQQVSQTASSGAWRQAQVLHAGEGRLHPPGGPQGRLPFHGTPDAAIRGQTPFAIQHHPQEGAVGRHGGGPAVRELGIIDLHGAPAHHDGFRCPAQRMGQSLDLRRGDFRTLARKAQGPFGSQGQFEGHPGQARADELEEGRVEAGAGLAQAAFFHGHPGAPQQGQAASIHPGVGVPNAHHHPGRPGPQQRVRAGGGPAVVAAGLQGHVGRGAPGVLAPGLRIPQGQDLPVGIPGPGVGPAAQEPPVPHQYTAHGRVGTGEPHALQSLPKGQGHPVFIPRKGFGIRERTAAGQFPGPVRHQVSQGAPPRRPPGRRG